MYYILPYIVLETQEGQTAFYIAIKEQNHTIAQYIRDVIFVDCLIDFQQLLNVCFEIPFSSGHAFHEWMVRLNKWITDMTCLPIFLLFISFQQIDGHSTILS